MRMRFGNSLASDRGAVVRALCTFKNVSGPLKDASRLEGATYVAWEASEPDRQRSLL